MQHWLPSIEWDLNVSLTNWQSRQLLRIPKISWFVNYIWKHRKVAKSGYICGKKLFGDKTGKISVFSVLVEVFHYKLWWGTWCLWHLLKAVPFAFSVEQSTSTLLLAFFWQMWAMCIPGKFRIFLFTRNSPSPQFKWSKIRCLWITFGGKSILNGSIEDQSNGFCSPIEKTQMASTSLQNCILCNARS